MKLWLKVLLVTLIVGLPTVLLGQIIWQVPPDMANAGPTPEGLQLILFILLSVFEGLAFGLGVAFLVFGWPLVQRLTNGSRGLGIASYLSVAWWLVSWWPHDNLHRTMSDGNLTALLAVEYGFHVTLIISSAIVALAFVRTIPRLIGQQALMPARADSRSAEQRVTA